MKLLMMCLGNICRSPLAEGALRARLAQARLDWVEVDSAGTGGWHVGEPPDRRSIAIAAEMGVDIHNQRARKLRTADFEDFDWILCADRSVLRDVRAVAPASSAASVGPIAGTALLLEWAGLEEVELERAELKRAGQAVSADIPDPYTGTQDDFRHVWCLVDTAAKLIVRRITESQATSAS